VNTCSRIIKHLQMIVFANRTKSILKNFCCVDYSNTGMNIKSDQSILNGCVLEYCGYLKFSCHTKFIEVLINSLLILSFDKLRMTLLNILHFNSHKLYKKANNAPTLF
jgi:hypothetical protein